MPKKYQACCAQFKQFAVYHKTCRRDRAGGEVSGRKLNVLLGKDPDDTNFMDPDNQHYVCYAIKHKADAIKGGDSRLKKKVPGGGSYSLQSTC